MFEADTVVPTPPRPLVRDPNGSGCSVEPILTGTLWD
jgi:hypothetical protein